MALMAVLAIMSEPSNEGWTPSGVKRVFTTNEIFDDLSTFEAIAKKGYAFKVTPAFRADKIMNAEAEAYPSYIDRLAGLCGKIANLDDLERAAEQRLQAFIAVGIIFTPALYAAFQRIRESVKTWVHLLLKHDSIIKHRK